MAVIFSVVGTLLAVGVPAFVRELHASHFVEPVDGLARIQTGAVAYAQAHAAAGVAEAVPPSAPVTPATPPRGTRTADPAGTWDAPTWKSLAFHPGSDATAPHAYAFGFDSTRAPAAASFRAHAHGDLDGDGVTSTFEVTGHTDHAGELTLDPGMFVADELE